MSLLATLVVIVGAVALISILVIAEIDRNSRPHRFGIALRSSHLERRDRGRWRWYLHPMFTPSSIDVIVGADRPAIAGYARTYLGANRAAHRARRGLEADLERERHEFLAFLGIPSAAIAEDDSRILFPPEISEQA